MEHKPFSLAERARSFRYAFNGLRLLLSCEHNAWIHATATVAALICTWWLNCSPIEWIIIILAIVMVISAEAVNSAIERLADRVSAEHDPAIGATKDLAAAAVLILALGAAAVGLIIFVPKIAALF